MPITIPPRRLYAWLLAALSAPLAHYSGSGWLAVALAAGAMLPLTLMYSDGWRRMGKWVSLLQFLWLIPVTAYLVAASAEYWPGGEGDWAVPVTLLALAALSANAEKASRAGSAVAWLLILTAIPLSIAGFSQIRLERLPPYQADWQAGLLVSLLIPSLAGLWEHPGPARPASRIGAAVLAVIPALLVQGVLSGTVAGAVETPFYEMARTLGLWGGRWEPLAAVAVTLGWYALSSFLFAAATELGTRAGIPEKWCPWLTFLGTTAFAVLRISVNGTIMLVVALILWVLAPMLHEKIQSKKDEKSA